MILLTTGCSTLKKALGIVDPEPIVITVEREVLLEVPDIYLIPCELTKNLGSIAKGSDNDQVLRVFGAYMDNAEKCESRQDSFIRWYGKRVEDIEEEASK